MKKTIIFDFDGTIINTNQLIEEGLSHFAITFRGTHLSSEEHQFLLGLPLEDQMKYINPKQYIYMTEAFRAWYLKKHNSRVSVFKGMDDIIAFLHDENYKLGIVSNNSRETVAYGLKQLKMEKLFKVIVTSDDVSEKKPSPEGLFKAMTLLDATPEACLFIGDSANDILAGHRAGLESVLVGWSLMEPQQIECLEPDYMIEKPSDLLSLIGIVDTLFSTQKNGDLSPFSQHYAYRLSV